MIYPRTVTHRNTMKGAKLVNLQLRMMNRISLSVDLNCIVDYQALLKIGSLQVKINNSTVNHLSFSNVSDVLKSFPSHKGP